MRRAGDGSDTVACPGSLASEESDATDCDARLSVEIEWGESWTEPGRVAMSVEVGDCPHGHVLTADELRQVERLVLEWAR